MQKITSHDNATVASGSIVNEVEYTYNGFGQLVTDAQEHAAAVDPNSLYAAYTWTEDTGDNHSRLDHMTYPNGRDLYSYYTNRDASSTFQNEIDDAFSRVGQLGNDPNGIYVDYTFAGRSRLIQRASPTGAGFKGNGTILDYDPGTAGEYAGLDFKGRVVNQDAHEDGNVGVIQSSMQYRSNPNGTPKFAEPQNSVVLGKADFYTYDGLERLSQIDAGRLNSGRTAITAEWSTPQTEALTMDAVGNMTAIDHKNSGTSASESRTYNCLNQITGRTITAHKPVYWINDPFTDNDKDQWVIPDIVSGSDGTWSGSSGKLQCDTAVTVTNSPSNGNGSIILADIGSQQDIQLSAVVTLTSSGDNGGLVFGYTDIYNFWLLIANRTATRYELWQVTGTSSRTWTLRASGGSVSGSGGTFNLAVEIRSGGVECLPSSIGNYTATIPAGQVGVWAGSSTASVKFDNFKALSLAAFADVEGRFWDDVGDTSLSSGKLNFAVVTGIGSLTVEKRAIRRGFRGGKYVLEVDATTVDEQSRGVILHYQDNENYMAVKLRGTVTNFDGSVVTTPSLVKRVDGVVSTVTSNSNFNMNAGDRVICAIHNDPGNAALQELKVYVNGTLRLTSTGIDDTWSAGMCGLVMFNDCSSAVQFDNFKIGYDNNADDDCDDGGDDVQIDDNFSSNAITLMYANNGSLTDDGIFLYVYDAWNRLVKAKRRVDQCNVVATYSYDGTNRRAQYQIQNSGSEVDSNDGGDTTVHSYFAGNKRVETRNASHQTTYQYVWGSQNRNELVLFEKNGDPTAANDSNPDTTGGAESGESPTDQRWFEAPDSNWRGLAIVVYDVGGTNNGRIAERFVHSNMLAMFTRIGPGALDGDTGAVIGYSHVGIALLPSLVRLPSEVMSDAEINTPVSPISSDVCSEWSNCVAAANQDHTNCQNNVPHTCHDQCSNCQGTPDYTACISTCSMNETNQCSNWYGHDDAFCGQLCVLCKISLGLDPGGCLSPPWTDLPTETPLPDCHRKWTPHPSGPAGPPPTTEPGTQPTRPHRLPPPEPPIGIPPVVVFALENP